MRRGPYVALGCLFGVSAAILLFWRVQATRMERDFREALAAGRVTGLTVGLTGKAWTADDLATARVLRLDNSYNVERALLRWVHTQGDVQISEERFSYQGSVTDISTGIRHVFGYRRAGGGWQYQSIHRDSMQRHIEQRTSSGKAN